MNQETLKLDIDYAKTLVGGDVTLVQEVFTDFQQQIPEYVSQLGNYYQQSQYEQLVATIHTIGGAASYIGATQVSKLSKQIEYHYKKDQVIADSDYQTLVGWLQSIRDIDINKFI